MMETKRAQIVTQQHHHQYGIQLPLDNKLSNHEPLHSNRRKNRVISSNSSQSEDIIVLSESKSKSCTQNQSSYSCLTLVQKLLLHYLFTSLILIMVVYCFIQLSMIKYDLDLVKVRVDRLAPLSTGPTHAAVNTKVIIT